MSKSSHQDTDKNAILQAWNAERTKRLGEALGADTKAARERLRSTLEPGFYVAVSPKRQFVFYIIWGTCYMLPGLDF